MFLLRLLALPVALLALPVGAAPPQSLDELQDQARWFLESQHGDPAKGVEIRVLPPDPRLRLAPCGEVLEAFAPPGARALGATSVGLRCPGPRPWTVYLRARVQVYDEVLVAARHLERGQVLTAADLSRKRRDLATLPGGYLLDPARAVGLELRRSLRPGTVLTPRALAEPLAVRRGEQVGIIARTPGMEVSSRGVALGDAPLGGRVKVRNSASGRVVEGTVTADHQVETGQ